MSWNNHEVFSYSPPIEYHPNMVTYECYICGKQFEVDVNKASPSEVRHARDGWTKLPYDPPYNNPKIHKYFCDDCAKKVEEFTLERIDKENIRMLNKTKFNKDACEFCKEEIKDWWYVNMGEVTRIVLPNAELLKTVGCPQLCQKCEKELFDFIEELKEENDG
jgi:uncharacterized protein YlaI